MKVPRDMDDAKALGKVLSKYKDTFYVQVLVAYFATYILIDPIFLFVDIVLTMAIAKGVAPPSFVAIKAGTTLYQLTTAGEAVSWNSVFVLMILALLSILPAIFQKKLKQKFE
ncbi:Transmembrane protein 41B [Camelus dromedarius]|uniref:Transmembrane protein 41B n=1 Tax=Camelus dromedarius TaxID=9838 RepID=A0A5N4DN25_CAMDR|nr:Transmembrane protein 41B [Camelus dromedarius]